MHDWDSVKSSVDRESVPYCNGSINTNYYHSNQWKYYGNKCDWNLTGSDVGRVRGIENPYEIYYATSFGIFNEEGTQTHVIFSPEVERMKFKFGWYSRHFVPTL